MLAFASAPLPEEAFLIRYCRFSLDFGMGGGERSGIFEGEIASENNCLLILYVEGRSKGLLL